MEKTSLNGILIELQDEQLLYAMMHYISEKDVGRDRSISEFFGVIDSVLVQPQESTVQTMLRSGGLSLIKGVILNNELIEHDDGSQGFENEYKRHETFSREFVAGYFMENMDYSFLSDRYFKNILFSLIGIYKLSLGKQVTARERLKNTWRN